ncbi:hypothetical protein QF043_000764 [Pseudomonas sp. W3I7]|uniref:hypothetical protein n=1 Tax=Pseudomonas sp. W3I7 TaxID=3042292 RepID=UPI00278E06E3|nr:hypothetical protein [Pseudomonas sp. W3I7]MDQ0701972.1 hypothetical protein [Pseudomonas sp. W3I7]
MEETAMNPQDIILAALAKATQLGPIEAPNALVKVIGAQTDPLQAISDREASNEIFEAIRSQFTFVDLLRSGKIASDEEFERLAGLFRWMIQEGAGWTISNDPRRTQLVALLVVGQFTTMGSSFWATVPNDFRPNDELLSALESMIAGIKISFTTHGLSAPIWESEALERFEKADTESDWTGIEQGWRLIERGFRRGIAIAQAAQCLDRFSPQRLITAVSGLQQTLSIMGVVLSLNTNSALRLGSGSSNPHVQFATTYISTSNMANREPLDETCKKFLVQILKSVSEDTPRWAAWMRVFNLFPSRYQELQIPLGCVLADANDAALESYVDAISLHWSGLQTRFSIADCLRSFRNIAKAKKRKTMWNFAFQRWKSWRFGLNGSTENLIKISRCELDFALVGYAVECLNDAQREQMVGSLTTKLQNVENNWHPAITDCHSEWNAVLSEMQPLFLAISVAGTEADWIDKEPTMRLPFDPDKEAYVTLKYGRPQLA